MRYIKNFKSLCESTHNNGYTFEDGSVGCHHGQTDMAMRMYQDGKLLAKVDYVIYNNEISISFIESYVKGRGYGQELMKELAKKYGYENLQRNSLTEDGVKMRKKLDKFYNFDYAAHEESKNKHLPKTILGKIKDNRIKEFLKHMINIGYSETWDIWRDTQDGMGIMREYDMNDISEIAEWIKGSVIEHGDLQEVPPDYILKLLKKLISE